MLKVFFALTFFMLWSDVYAQPMDQLITKLEEQNNAKVISVQQRRGGYRVRLLQSNGVVKTIHYRPEGWAPPPRPRVFNDEIENDSREAWIEQRRQRKIEQQQHTRQGDQ
jgi:hypothetical protein